MPNRIHISSIEFFFPGARAIEEFCAVTSAMAIRGWVFLISAAGESSIPETAAVSVFRPEESDAAATGAGISVGIGMARGVLPRGSGTGNWIRAVSRGFMFGFGGPPGGESGASTSTFSFLDWFGLAMKQIQLKSLLKKRSLVILDVPCSTSFRAKSRSPVARLKGNFTGYLDFARQDKFVDEMASKQADRSPGFQ